LRTVLGVWVPRSCSRVCSLPRRSSGIHILLGSARGIVRVRRLPRGSRSRRPLRAVHVVRRHVLRGVRRTYGRAPAHSRRGGGCAGCPAVGRCSGQWRHTIGHALRIGREMPRRDGLGVEGGVLSEDIVGIVAGGGARVEVLQIGPAWRLCVLHDGFDWCRGWHDET
jgi:hypothetical protein